MLLLLLLLLLFSEQRPETLTVDDLKHLRYLECVIKVRVDLVPHTEIPTTLKYNLYAEICNICKNSHHWR